MSRSICFIGPTDTSKEVVREILTDGTSTRSKYISWLDRLADFALNLKDSKGELIPVILRIYHEHTQGWSWWGSSCTTAQEFIDLWRMTVSYLRDTKGVHNFLYAVSPQMDEVYADARGRLLYRWPGDDWVDFIGMDCYHGTGINAFTSNLKALAALSVAKHKPCGVTEDGLESFTQTDFWSRYVLGPVGDTRISMITMWRNKYVGSNESDKHYFSVYPGHPSEDDFTFLSSLQKVIDMVVASQYPSGGWPQRYPLMHDHPFRGKADYTSFVTINDNVTPENIRFLLQCYTSLGMSELREPILRGMRCLRDLQQPSPLAGWADQYTPDDLLPAHARSYEPRAVNTGTTTSMIRTMIEYYKLTGDKSFLKGIPDAIAFIEHQELPRELASQVRRAPMEDDEILVPRFINPDNGRPLYVHRRGSNVENGEYLRSTTKPQKNH